MRYDYEWPLRYPPRVLDEAFEIALDYLQGTGQAVPWDGTDHVVAAVILAERSRGIKHPIRLANSAIRTVERGPQCVPSPPVGLRARLKRDRFFDC
jgi:hypothetical protein